MAKPKWNKYTMPLPPTHGWACSPGFTLFVADRGALRFEFPQGWVHGPEDDGSIGFHDRKPPDDDCSLKASIIRLPPGIHLADLNRGMPLDGLIVSALAQGEREVTFDGQVYRADRPGTQVAWAQVESVDPKENRALRSRMLMARAPGVQPLITMDYWTEFAGKFEPVWDNLVRSLGVAQPVAGIGGESAN